MSARLQVVHMDDTVTYYQDFTDWKYAYHEGVPLVLVRTGPPRTPGQQRIEIPLCNVRSIRVIGTQNGNGVTMANEQAQAQAPEQAREWVRAREWESEWDARQQVRVARSD